MNQRRRLGGLGRPSWLGRPGRVAGVASVIQLFRFVCRLAVGRFGARIGDRIEVGTGVSVGGVSAHGDGRRKSLRRVAETERLFVGFGFVVCDGML